MECQTCFRRFMRALAATHALPLRPVLKSTRRGLATDAIQATTQKDVPQNLPPKLQIDSDQEHPRQHSEQTQKPADQLRPTWKENKQLKQKRVLQQAALETVISGKPSPQTQDALEAPGRERRLAPKHIQTELKYLQDPFKLADHVRYVLQHNDEEKALALVRLASKSFANTVSWNHIIDWQMKKGKTRAATDTYNELKKRGQKPDSHTYLLLLRGLASYASNPTSLGKALSLYHSMSAPKSNVSPTIIHTNAVLKVCARANDMESLWDIASRLPDKGPHAANVWTFTTIINNLRINATDTPISDDTIKTSAERREELIIEGKRLWTIIISRWRQGDIVLDEELVCSMGRLLLVGNRPLDWDSVLSLIHQTMNIPRLIPRLGSSARPSAPVPSICIADAQSSIHIDANAAEQVEEKATSEKAMSEKAVSEEAMSEKAMSEKAMSEKAMSEKAVSEEAMSEKAMSENAMSEEAVSETEDEFDPFSTTALSLTSSASVISNLRSTGIRRSVPRIDAYTYASPGNSTLSLIMESCLKTRAKKPAQEYWTIITSPDTYNVIPDLDNVQMHLRILRQSRASADAVAFLKDDILTQLKITPTVKMFRLAMSACARDNNNAKSLDYAFEVFELMQRHLDHQDAKTMAILAQRAVAVTDPRVIKDVIERLEPATASLRSLMSFGRPGMLMGERKEQVNRADTFDLIRKLIALYDRLFFEIDEQAQQPGQKSASDDHESALGGILTKKQRAIFLQRQNKLTAYVTVAANKEERRRRAISSSPSPALLAKRATEDAATARKQIQARESGKVVREPKKWKYSRQQN